MSMHTGPRKDRSSPYHPSQPSSDHSPDCGPNFRRPDVLAPQAKNGPIHGHGVTRPMDAMDGASVEFAEERLCSTGRLFERHALTSGISIRRNKQVMDRVRAMATAGQMESGNFWTLLQHDFRLQSMRR